jgi:hypothetical protein
MGYIFKVMQTCLLAVGEVPKAVSGLMQWALLTEQTLCNEVGLLVNPDKTELVIFTRERNSRVSLNHIFLGLHCRSRLVKYLRVILDSADMEGARGCYEEGSQLVVGL